MLYITTHGRTVAVVPNIVALTQCVDYLLKRWNRRGDGIATRASTKERQTFDYSWIFRDFDPPREREKEQKERKKRLFSHCCLSLSLTSFLPFFPLYYYSFSFSHLYSFLPSLLFIGRGSQLIASGIWMRSFRLHEFQIASFFILFCIFPFFVRKTEISEFVIRGWMVPLQIQSQYMRITNGWTTRRKNGRMVHRIEMRGSIEKPLKWVKECFTG